MNRRPESNDVPILRDILHRSLARYLSVLPSGLQLERGQRPRKTIEARILGYGGARSLYKHRKPVCRSLDGIRPVTGDTERLCRACETREHCTSQVRVDLIAEGRPLRLLLAYSNARAFLAYDTELKQRGLAIENILSKLTVVDRKTWGELRFSALD
jgi:hypothetical protein